MWPAPVVLGRCQSDEGLDFFGVGASLRGCRDVTAESQFASQALQAGSGQGKQGTTASGGQRVQKCSREAGCGDGHGLMGASPGRLIGRLADGECYSAFPLLDETRHALQLPSFLSVLSRLSTPVSVWTVWAVDSLPTAQVQLVHSQPVSQCLIRLRLACLRGSTCGPRSPLTPTPALNFVDGAWHFSLPTGTYCRPTDAGLCVGLTRGRGCSDVNASAISAINGEDSSIMASSGREQPRIKGLAVAVVLDHARLLSRASMSLQPPPPVGRHTM